MNISIVVPAFNESASLATLHAEITSVLRTFGHPYEIILVDDGSNDGTDRVMRELAAADSNVHAFRLSRNQGKSAAYRAGFARARGSIIITLDGDLQDDPNEIPRMLDALHTCGLDLVVGWKQQRMQNEPSKAFPSKLFNHALRLLFGLRLHDSNSGFRALRAEVVPSLVLRGDYYRFIPQIAHLKGYHVGEIAVRHRPRQHGSSKYGWSRFLTGVLDAIALRFTVSFSEKPLHAFGGLSLPFLFTGAGLELYVLARKLAGDAFANHIAALLVGVLLLIIGVQVLSIGLIGVLVAAGRSHDENQVRIKTLEPTPVQISEPASATGSD